MRGWILDLYPGNPEQMVVWLKRENGEPVRLVDSWSPSIYIAADDRADLGIPLKIVGEELAWTRVVQRRERVTDQGTTEVVEAKVKDAKHVQQLAGRIERLGPFGAFRIYNADVPPNQSYLYERDLFPLAYCEVEQRNGTLEWKLEDDVWAYDYRIPNLRKVKVDVEIEKRGRLARFTDPLKAVTLESDSGKVVIEGGSEAGMILDLARAVREADPDFILTTDGDTFLFPYLIKRAEASGVAGRLTLGRDGTLMALPARKGTSYFQYGRIRYKPSAMKLYGRVHIDVNTSFAFSEAGFEGLFELSRICRMPLHTSSRASIGKALSSLQFYHASKMGLARPLEADSRGALQGQVGAAGGRPRGLHLRAEDGTPRERRGAGLQFFVPKYYAQEEHLGGDSEVRLLPRLEEQGAGAGLERLREEDGNSPDVDQDHSREEAEVQGAEEELERRGLRQVQSAPGCAEMDRCNVPSKRVGCLRQGRRQRAMREDW